MKHDATRPHRRATRAAFAFVLAAAFGATYALPLAQVPTKKVLTVDDYSTWRTIGGQEISGDGNWVTYGLSFTNTVPADSKPVLHLVRVGSSQHVEVPNATGGIFSADSKWLAYQVDPSGGRGGRGRRGAGAGDAPASVDDPAVPQGVPGNPPPVNPAQATTPPGQNPATSPSQPPAMPPAAPAPPAPATAPATPSQPPAAAPAQQ